MTAPITTTTALAASATCRRCGRIAEADSDVCTRHRTLRDIAASSLQREQQAEIDAWEQADHTADRANLLGLARAWGDTLQSLVHTGGLDRGVATSVLLDAARGWCHPNARPAVVFLMPALISAVDEVQRLHDGALDPHDIIGELRVYVSRFELALDALNTAVDEALAPMLHGTRAGA